jgi:hypothetical protein
VRVAIDHFGRAGPGWNHVALGDHFLQLLLNDKEVLGVKFVNRPWNNWVNWTIIIVLFILSLIQAAQVLVPRLFPST